MSLPEQKKIRCDHACDVIRAVAQLGECTRAQIADRIGLSLMSVGKLVDALEAGGFVAQSKKAGDRPGRQAGVFRIAGGNLMILVSDGDGILLYSADWTGAVERIDRLESADAAVQEFFVSCGMPSGAACVIGSAEDEAAAGSAVKVLEPFFGGTVPVLDDTTAAGLAMTEAAGVADVELILVLCRGECIRGRLFLGCHPLGSASGDFTGLWNTNRESLLAALKPSRILESNGDPDTAARGAALLLRRHLIEQQFS